jgi:hypothetical protein
LPEILGKTGFVTNGLVAQSVEQRIENPCVGGSIPPRATKKQGVALCAAPFLFQPVNELSTDLAVREFLSLPGFPEGAY